jgi:hypothetical protein
MMGLDGRRERGGWIYMNVGGVSKYEDLDSVCLLDRLIEERKGKAERKRGRKREKETPFIHPSIYLSIYCPPRRNTHPSQIS